MRTIFLAVMAVAPSSVTDQRLSGPDDKC